MTFEWDDIKARANLRDHGVTFEQAKQVFTDRAATIEFDHSEPSEVRWRTVGLSGGTVLFVVYTEQSDDAIHVIRIITARKATKREAQRYYTAAAP